ncbi:MAG: hypothetical protein HYZ28_20400 [Myxococcales bacterium]|nr:hypothetical protein [Myxococcales bacterium]
MKQPTQTGSHPSPFEPSHANAFGLASLGAVALLSLGLAGCPNGGNLPAAGEPDGSEEQGEVEVTASGFASVHPAAAQYLQSKGEPVPSVAGLTLRVEEPFKVALNDPTGIFGELTLTGAGTFSVSGIRSSQVILGIAAGIKDDSDAGVCGVDGGIADGGCGPAQRRVIRSATSLYDVALEGKKPDKDVVGTKAYAVPAAFHDQLTQAVTEARIRQLTGPNNKGTLIEAGFMLGRIVDASGNPVAGARVSPSPDTKAGQFFYPSSDVSSASQTSTSSNGLFLFVHSGGDVDTFKFAVEGKPEYLTRNAGAAKDACLVTTVYPGKTPPP